VQEPASILIIEDYTMLSRALAQTLTAGGYQVLTAYDADQALSFLKTNSVGLILSDYSMPYEGDTSLCSYIQDNKNGFKDVPVVCFSSRNINVDVRQDLGLAPSDMITMPIEPEDLLEKVGRKIKRNRETKTISFEK